MTTLFQTVLYRSGNPEPRKLRLVEKESVIEFLSEYVTIEGYLQFEHIVFV
jgi:hypothetical protein